MGVQRPSYMLKIIGSQCCHGTAEGSDRVLNFLNFHVLTPMRDACVRLPRWVWQCQAERLGMRGSRRTTEDEDRATINGLTWKIRTCLPYRNFNLGCEFVYQRM